MSKFRVGDRIRFRDYLNGTVSYSYFDGRLGVDMDLGYNHLFHKWDYIHLKHIGDSTMSKYDQLKQRIALLENGWDKEADDIKNEINSNFSLGVCDFNSNGTIWTHRSGSTDNANHNTQEKFHYGSQCEKHSAFKQALLWLLDHSDIKKDLVGKEVKAEIEGKVYKVKVLKED